jgi:hypothetical protein
MKDLFIAWPAWRSQRCCPAAFWVAVGAAIAKAAGVTIAASALISVGAVIALFLGSVCAPIMLKSDQR